MRKISSLIADWIAMFREAFETAKSFAQALGSTADTARPRNDLFLEKATEEGRLITTSKRKTSDKMSEAQPEMQALLADEQRHSRTRLDAVAAAQLASQRDMARSGKAAINFLNEDMLSDYEGEEHVSQRSKGQQGYSKSMPQKREVSAGDEYDSLKRKYWRLREKLQAMDVEASNLTDENSQIKAEKKDLEKEIRFLDSFLHVIKDLLLRPYAEATGHDRYTASMFQNILHDALEAKTLKQQTIYYQDQIVSLHKKEQSLQEHVTILQQELLSNVEKASIVSDEHFTQDFRWLASSIKTLSRNIRFPADIDLADIPAIKSARLLNNVDKAHWNGRGRKKALIEAFLWSVLIYQVFGSPFGIAGPGCASEINDWWAKLFGRNHVADWPLPGDLAERWRSMTVEQVVKLGGKEAITRGIITTEQGAAIRQDILDSILKGRTSAYKLITETLGELSPATDFLQVPVIIDKAFSLALEMNIQRCRLQAVYPKIGDLYSQGEPSYLKSNLNDEEADEGTVAVIVNPGLVKWGDGHGKNLDQELVLVPCDVIIAPLPNDDVSTEVNVSFSSVQAMQAGYDNFMKTPKSEDHRRSAQTDSPSYIEDDLVDLRPNLGRAFSQQTQFSFPNSESPDNGVGLK
ncbi:uncharacterized protein N0V89_001143 [Didymosphaeria variabile]|uniref:Uncharacterized protein n=1 Tax=Didymosphaeria variabile TaxID=1932322 RepID=A0A9W8XVK5_9PLEO|nr:uncharacterized protein N0V89_001143 [Didymosphaeria variabile]KAJ4360577.1 hypothetical protein N0V89_001143 [Didymosphaeria variabile]